MFMVGPGQQFMCHKPGVDVTSQKHLLCTSTLTVLQHPGSELVALRATSVFRREYDSTRGHYAVDETAKFSVMAREEGKKGSRAELCSVDDAMS